MLKVYGSEHCPDCTAAKEALDEDGIAYEFIEILESLDNLHEYIVIRDKNDALFEKVKKVEGLGIPMFVADDGSVSLNVNNYLK